MAPPLTVVGGEVRRFAGATAAASGRRRWEAREGFLLLLRDDHGRVGLGEASPLPGFSREDAESCRRALADFVATLPLTVDLAAGPQRWLAAAAMVAPAAAHMAVETALLDLAGRALDQSLAALLAGCAPAGGVALAALAQRADPEGLAAAAAAAATLGITTLKVKVGRQGAFAAELAALQSLRDVGRGITLRLDVNGGWSIDEARDNLSRLVPLEPEFVEQPVAAEALLELGAAPVPVAADESLLLPGALERLLASGNCSVLVLKPMALGGLVRAFETARAARVAGLDVVISHLFDGPVALAAACELALALPAPPLACGLAPHHGLAAWPPVAVTQIRGGRIMPSVRPGLGLEPEAFA